MVDGRPVGPNCTLQRRHAGPREFMVQYGNLHWLPAGPRIRSAVSACAGSIGRRVQCFPQFPVTTGRRRHAVSAPCVPRQGPCRAMGRRNGLAGLAALESGMGGAGSAGYRNKLVFIESPLLMRLGAHDLGTKSSQIVVPTDPGTKPKAAMPSEARHRRQHKRSSQEKPSEIRGATGSQNRRTWLGSPDRGLCVRLASQSAWMRSPWPGDRKASRRLLLHYHALLRRRRLGNHTALSSTG